LKSIVITGASGGIGSALAKLYAKPGVVLGFIARDEKQLRALTYLCQKQGAIVEYAAIDVRDREALHQWLQAFDQRHPIDCLIANAGVTCGLLAHNVKECDEEADRLTDVNYKGVVHTVTGVVENMRLRGKGHIVLMSSLAGLEALADMPSYSATKAAVIAYGHAIRRWLNPYSVKVSIICPGFVTTPMSARHIGKKPFEISAEKAAKKIQKAIQKHKRFYAFPFILTIGLYLCRLMPLSLSDYFMRSFRANIKKDPKY